MIRSSTSEYVIFFFTGPRSSVTREREIENTLSPRGRRGCPRRGNLPPRIFHLAPLYLGEENNPICRERGDNVVTMPRTCYLSRRVVTRVRDIVTVTERRKLFSIRVYRNCRYCICPSNTSLSEFLNEFACKIVNRPRHGTGRRYLRYETNTNIQEVPRYYIFDGFSS